MKEKRPILLSFDVEEFDLPREHGVEISLEEGVRVSVLGLKRILQILKKEKVRATFFVTGNFAKLAPEMILKIVREGHEVGCHGVDHFRSKARDMAESKKMIENIIKKEFPDYRVKGYRQPRMGEIDYVELKRCGYEYDSSVNPTFMPGRYNHFNEPRKPFYKEGILEIPTSVATKLRMPLFWLTLHLFPRQLYVKLAQMALRRDGYFATYFHPWEFGEIAGREGVPRYIQINSGKEMTKRLRFLIRCLKEKGEFRGYGDLIIGV